MMSRDPSKAAHTYSFRFGRRNLWKIGHAQDLDNRLAEVNKHVPEEAVGEKWERYLIQKWPDSETAYEMEQTVLVILTARRTVGERVICNQRELEEAWTKAAATVSSRRRRVPLG